MDDNIHGPPNWEKPFGISRPTYMSAIQTLRAQAQSLGNLPSTAQENVVGQDGDIEIEPANPDDMYVPNYDPDTIYYDPGIYCTFGIGLPLGGWLGYGWDWGGRHLYYWHGGLPGNWWHESPGWRHNISVAIPRPPAWQGLRTWRRMGPRLCRRGPCGWAGDPTRERAARWRRRSDSRVGRRSRRQGWRWRRRA